MHLTEKQNELMRIIVAGNPDGSLADLDQIVERANYKPTKQSLQFSLRSLIGHKLIEKAAPEIRNNRQHAVYKPTNAGLGLMGKSVTKPDPSFVVDADPDFDFDEVLESVFGD